VLMAATHRMPISNWESCRGLLKWSCPPFEKFPPFVGSSQSE
jgi:hypothetical protein